MHMKTIVFLIGLGLFLMIGAVGCEEVHEHHHGGAYDGYYQDSGHYYRTYPDYRYDPYYHH